MGSGFRTFQSGEVLTASNVQNFLMEQSVMTFAGTAALGSAIGTAVEPGMVAYLTDSDQIIHYRADAVQGTAWQAMPMVGGAANVVINGAMQVAQRGTSTASITTGGYYTADRFQTTLTTMGTWTQTVENDAPTGSGLRKSLKMLCTTADASPAAGDVVHVRTFLEGQNLQQFLKGTSAAKQFTVSFYVKALQTGTYILRLQDFDNNRSVSAAYTVVASNTWEKKTITFPADTTGAFDNDNALSLTMDFALGAGSDRTSGTLNTTWQTQVLANIFVGQTNVAAATNNYWQITGVQLEPGSVATPFEFEDIGTTLAKCERYYQRIVADASTSRFGLGSVYSTTQATVTTFLRTKMRAAPTALETTGTASNYAVASANATGLTVTSIVFATANRDVADTTITVASGLVGGDVSPLYANGTTSAYLAWSAEL